MYNIIVKKKEEEEAERKKEKEEGGRKRVNEGKERKWGRREFWRKFS